MSPSLARATEGGLRLRSGQAMIETVLAVLIISSLFLTLFGLSRQLTGKILLEHAAMRVARARAVGFNDFMCRKAARICVIPVSGRRLKPVEGDVRGDISEPALARMYMRTPNAGYADGLLQYEDWNRLTVEPGRGGASKTALKTDWMNLSGEAEVDGYPIYLLDQGI